MTEYLRFLYLFIFLIEAAVCDEDISEEHVAVTPYTTPWPVGNVHFAEPFDAVDSIDSWTFSKANKEGVESEISKYNGNWKVEGLKENSVSGDMGLVLKDKARHSAISAPLEKPFTFDGEPFIMQYEVNFQSGIECGGAYVKLLTHSEDMSLTEFHDKSPYTIMFGPDKCGEDYKLHFIFRHKNPITGEFEEKHAKKTTADIKSYYTDKTSHLYTLIVNPDNTFKIYIDQKEINAGSLLSDVQPPVNPPAEIQDENDKKPEDWDERESIPDPTATKPEDWDEDAPAKIPDPNAEVPSDWLEEEPMYIDDPDASMPEDWDEEMDGEWEAPKVDNPKCASVSGCGIWEPPSIANPDYKGKWRAPMIPNPNYKGIWSPRMIPNPSFFEDKEPCKMTAIGAVGFELWSMSDEIYFDNIIITDDKSVADDYAEKTWKLKQQIKADSEPGLVNNLLNATEERPWLWVIYVLVVGLPVVLIFVFCCRSSKKDTKKTDEPTPDDPPEERVNEEDEDEKKDDEEKTYSQAEDEETAENTEEGEENLEEKKVSKADLEEIEDEEEEEAAAEEQVDGDSGEAGDAPSEKRSPRKRKSRVQE